MFTFYSDLLLGKKLQLDRTTEINVFLQHLSRCFDYAVWPWNVLTLCQYNQDYTNTKTVLRECILEVNEFVQFFSFSIVKPFLNFPIHFYFTELFVTTSVLLHVSSVVKIWFIHQLLFCVPIKFCPCSPDHCEHSLTVIISTIPSFLTSDLLV